LTDPQLLLPQIAATLGVRESGGQSIAQRLVAQFAGQRVLLVLDNLEQFRPQDMLSRAIADLLTATPGLAVLATSRAPLRLRFERELPLAPLAVPAGADMTIEALSASPSVRLFMERARAVRPGFVLGPRNAAAIAALCRRLDGLPLALELAAARVRALSPADILARLGERLDLLADPRSDRPDRQRTMEAAVAWSYDLLEPAQQAAFRRLSVFAGGSTLEAAEAVLGTFSEPALDGLDSVTALVEQGLLRNEEQPNGTLRFHMLETVRVFARERLREAGEEDLARQAHADHFRALATIGSQMEEQAAAHGDETAWLDHVEIDLDNVRAALQWTASERPPEALLTLVLGCWEFWWPRGYWTEARTWLERALAAAADTPPAMRAKALRALGVIADAAGHRERALALFEESLQLSRAHDDRDGEWATLLDLSLHWASRDYGEAGRYAETALAVAREVANRTMIARSLNRLGNWQLNIEHPRDAFTLHQEALGILESLGDERGIAETLDLLGIASILGADSSRAAGWFDRAIALWRTLGDRRGLASSLAGRTMCAHTFHTETIAASSTAAEVRPFGEESLTLSREIGWRAGESFALWAYRGLALSATGDFQTALPSAREALAIAQQIEHQQWIIGAHCTLGILHACLFDCDSARREFTEALTLAHDMGSLYWIRSASGWLAASTVRSGDLDAAGAIIDEHLHEETPLDTIACRLLWVAAAELALAREDAERALTITDRLVASAPGNARRPIPRLEWLRGEALTALGRFAEAEQALATASEVAIWCGARPLLWRIHAALARLHLARGHHEDAEQATKAAQAIVSELAASVPDEALRDIFLRHAMREPLSSGA
jgi:predicted ATPase